MTETPRSRDGTGRVVAAAPLRFSVAMCTYNGARFLREQLASFTSQTYLPSELIVCDDGSTDETFPMLQKFAEAAPFPVRLWRNESNLGYSRNFAQAIERCGGDLIALSDQDDHWHPNKLERLVKIFDKDPAADGVFSNGDLMDEQSHALRGDLWGSFDFKSADQRAMSAGRAVEVLLQRNVVTGMAFAFRASWRNQLRSMPASWPHDAWLALMMAIGGKLVPCSDRLVTYRVHEQQQVGVPITGAQKKAYLRDQGIGAYVDLSRDRNLREYRKDGAQYADLVTALQHGSPDQQRWLPQASAKAAHLRAAAERLGLPRLRRAPCVLAHWQDYGRYSPTGLRAMVRDLFLTRDAESR